MIFRVHAVTNGNLLERYVRRYLQQHAARGATQYDLPILTIQTLHGCDNVDVAKLDGHTVRYRRRRLFLDARTDALVSTFSADSSNAPEYST